MSFSNETLKKDFFSTFKNNPRSPIATDIPRSLLKDFEVMLYACSRNGLLYETLPFEFQNDFQITKACLMNYPKIYESRKFSKTLKKNRELAVIVLENSPMSFNFLDESFMGDKGIILKFAKVMDDNPHQQNIDFSEQFQKIPLDIRSDGEFSYQVISYFPDYYVCISDDLKNIKEIAMLAVSKKGLLIKNLPKEFKKDLDIALEALSNNVDAYTFIDKSIKENLQILLKIASKYPHYLEKLKDSNCFQKEILIALLKKNPNCLKYLPMDLIDEEIGLLIINLNPKLYPHLSMELRNNKEITKKAVLFDGLFLHKASDILKNDLEIVKIALKQNLNAFFFCSPELQNQKNFVIQCVKEFNLYLHSNWINSHISLFSDYEFIFQLCKLNGGMLEYASKNLRSDKKIMLIALDQTEKAFRYCLEFDEEIALMAVEKNGFNLQYAGKYRGNRKIVEMAINKSPFSFEFASEELRGDYLISLQAIQLNSSNFKFTVSEKIKNDPILLKEVLSKHGSCLESLSKNVKNNKELVMLSIENYPISYLQASESLQNDKEVVMLAITKEPKLFKFIPENYQSDKAIALKCLSKEGILLKYASKNLKNEIDVVLASVISNGLALEFATPNLKQNKEIVLAAIEQNVNSMLYANKSLREDRDVLFIGLRNGMDHETLKINGDVELIWMIRFKTKLIREIETFNIQFKFEY
jgi:hypothetical protein